VESLSFPILGAINNRNRVFENNRTKKREKIMNGAKIDLNTLDEAAIQEFMFALPKTDLHCHLDGSMRISTVRELAKTPENRALAESLGYSLPEDCSEKNLSKLLFPGHDCESLEDYLLAFDITCGVLQNAENLERAAYELAIDCYAENIWYLEVRFAPQRHIHDHLNGMEVMKAVDRGLDRAEKETKGGIKSRIIVCAMRHYAEGISYYHRKVREVYPYSTAKELASHCSLETARLAVQARKAGLYRIVAFDLAGPEANFPPSHHTKAFYEITNVLMASTVHAGEGYGPKSIREAITHLNANRIGHGTRVLEEDNLCLLHYLRDRRIAVEVCLTSNLQTKAISSLDKHPWRAFLDNEIRAPLCTDNRLVSGVTLTHEYILAHKHFNFTRNELRRTILYGFKSAFVAYADRRELLLKAKQRLVELGL
jgi:adenosine deaminase